MLNYEKYDIRERSFKFGIRVCNLTNELPKTPFGFEIGKQLVRSGTSIGANIEEAQSAVSKLDFINKLSISLKEARETKYWLRIIKETKINKLLNTDSLLDEIEEIIKILVTIIKNTKTKLNS